MTDRNETVLPPPSHSFGSYRYVPKGRLKNKWPPELDGKTKKCSKCKKIKPINPNFGINCGKYGRYKDGSIVVRSMCFECHRANARKVKGRFGAIQDAVRAYGITAQEYFDLSIQQGNRCAICRVSESELLERGHRNNKRLQVDHCHNVKRVRGLLCHDCNVAIGRLKDDPANALRAFFYLQEWKERIAA